LIVVFDASILVYVVDDEASPPTDPATGQPVEYCQARVVHLLNRLQQQQAKIIIPTPALAEVLVKADRAAAPEYLRILGSSRHFRLAPFDEKAAVEFADRQAERQSGGGRAPGETRAKAKFDDQILAIAAVEGATTIYSDDGGLVRLAESRFDVVSIADLPPPPEPKQGSLPFARPEGDSAEST
jgi:hypothetical protein